MLCVSGKERGLVGRTMSISDTSFLGTKMGKMHNILLNSLHPNLCGTVDLTQFKKKEGLLKKP